MINDIILVLYQNIIGKNTCHNAFTYMGSPQCASSNILQVLLCKIVLPNCIHKYYFYKNTSAIFYKITINLKIIILLQLYTFSPVCVSTCKLRDLFL